MVSGDKTDCTGGTEAERVRWTQRARRSVGNRKERVRDYASSPGDTNWTPPKEAIKKRPENSDRLVSGDKTDCTGGVYRARTYDLHDVNVAL